MTTKKLVLDLSATAIALSLLVFGLPLLLNANSTWINAVGAGAFVGFIIGVVAVIHKKYTSAKHSAWPQKEK